MKRFLTSAALATLFASPASGQSLNEIRHAHDQECAKSHQTKTPDNDKLNNCGTPARDSSEIIVTGTRIGTIKTRHFTAPVTIMTNVDIDNRNALFIADILRSVPGAAVNRSGPQGALTQLRLRGSEGNHVMVLVDGVEVSNPNTGEFDFANLSAEDVVRVEVLRGEQSALWGSDAIGGVVNIITRADETNESYKLSLEAGGLNTLDGQVSAVIPVGEAALSVNGHAYRTDGYDVSGLDGEKDGAKSRSLNIGLNTVKLGGLVLSVNIQAAMPFLNLTLTATLTGGLTIPMRS